MNKKDSPDLLLAEQYIKENKPNQLRQLLETSIKPDDMLSCFKAKTLRHKVPLLCVAVYTESLECAQVLLNAGANIEIEDGGFILFSYQVFL